MSRHRRVGRVAAVGVLVTLCLGCTPAAPEATPTTPATPASGPSPATPPALHVSPAARPGCAPRSPGVFPPERVAVPRVGSFAVQSLPRLHDASGGISSQGPTDFNPSVFAWDNESAEVGSVGNVLLTAHTYRTDQSALGNRLLAELHDGEIVRMDGAAREVACYRVVERLEVAAESYPVDRVYLDHSKRQAVITVCSGLSGGVWTERTLWFLQPVA